MAGRHGGFHSPGVAVGKQGSIKGHMHASGLVTDARAIFLDEPTTGLDSDSAEQLIALLSHLATQKHRTVRAFACRPHSTHAVE